MTKLPTYWPLLALLGCAHGTGASPPREQAPALARYAITIFDNWSGAKARVCLEGAAVRQLAPIESSAGRRLVGAWADGDALQIRNGHIVLPDLGARGCVDYETRFESPTFRSSDALVVSQTQWLWRPEPLPAGLRASVRFALPSGARASLPWPRSEAVFFPDESAFRTSTYGVFGNFDRQTFSVSDTSIEVARLGEPPTGEAIRRWLASALRAAASLGDRFPNDRLHFVVIPVPARPEPVAFGMLRRGGGSSVLLFPSLHATDTQLETDWVAVHELSHLWLPRLYPEDRWLSEGVATYLQEVLRARCGLQSSENAWTRLREGFARGSRAGTGRTLALESHDMNRTGAYYRVYWAGAAFALEADLRLRKESDGTMTLLRAIHDARERWGAGVRLVHASEFLRALAEATGEDFFEELAETYAIRSDFESPAELSSPDYEEARAQVMSRPDGGCGISAESSR